MLILGMLILLARNTDPILQPVLYAEDGAWLSQALTNGWGYAFLHARQDYFVWGNLLLLAVASGLSSVACGSPISCAAETTAWVSYAFYSLLPLASFLVTRGLLSLPMRWVLWGAVLLLPLGASANEMLGRLSNVGFHFVYLSAILLFAREHLRGWNLRAADMGLLLCMATNPVCILLVCAWTAASLLEAPKAWRHIVQLNIWVLLGVALLLLAFSYRYIAFSPPPPGSNVAEHGIELLFARAVFYPFVFPFYTALSDWVVILTAVLFSLLWWVSYSELRKAGIARESLQLQRLLQVLLLGLLLFTLALLSSRTQMLSGIHDYQSTYPDRYFSGHNLIVVVLFVLAAGGTLQQKKYVQRSSSFAVLASLALAYGFGSPSFFEGAKPATVVAVSGTAHQSLCLGALYRHHPADRVVPMNMHTDMPVPIGIPAAVLMRSTRGNRCESVWADFFPTDVNWHQGIARQGATFLLPATPAYLGVWHPGQELEIYPADRRQVLAVEQADPFVRVHLSGPNLAATSVSGLLEKSRLLGQPSFSDSALPVTFSGWAWGLQHAWKQGVSTIDTAFLVLNTPANRNAYVTGKQVLFVSGEKREIKQAKPVAHLLLVWLNGGPLDPDRVGFPHRLQLLP